MTPSSHPIRICTEILVLRGTLHLEALPLYQAAELESSTPIVEGTTHPLLGANVNASSPFNDIGR